MPVLLTNNFVSYVIAFASTFLLSIILTFFARKFAIEKRVLDFPDSERKIHITPTPALGGIGVYGAFLISTVLWNLFSPDSFGNFIKIPYLAGILIGGLILNLGGYFDDKFKLPPGRSIIAPVLAVLCVLLFGVNLSYINHPLGGALLLDTFKVSGYAVWGGVFVFFWILGMIYTTKFLDGIDGLAAGISGIGCLILLLVSRLPEVNQPDTALLCAIFAGAVFGFLPWNFYPAKIFLGEGGSTFLGFMIGTLAVISGGKIATALLVMGIPILDVFWVIIRRLAQNFSPFAGDRKHLHYRLLDWGLSQRQTVLLLYFLSAMFGVSGLFLQSLGKLFALFLMLIVMVFLGSFLVLTLRDKNAGKKKNQG